MLDKDYIKEKLNTLRVILMARVLILIAVGGGISRLIYNILILKESNRYSYYFLVFSIVVFVVILIKLFTGLKDINTLTDKLK